MKKIIGLFSTLMCMLPTCVLADVVGPDVPVVSSDADGGMIIVIVGIIIAVISLITSIIAIVISLKKNKNN
jgi:hypothetical protein